MGPPIEVLRRHRFGSEVGIVVVAGQRFVHHAGDDPELLGVLDERVGRLSVGGRREVRSTSLERVAPCVDRVGHERLHHTAGRCRGAVLEPELGVERGRVGEAGARRQEARDLDVGILAGRESPKEFENRPIADDDRRIALLRAADTGRDRRGQFDVTIRNRFDDEPRIADTVDDESSHRRASEPVAKVRVVHGIVDGDGPSVDRRTADCRGGRDVRAR